VKTTEHILAVLMIAAAFVAGPQIASAGKPSRPPPPPPPAEPPARAWHGFAGNGSPAADASRLYLFGGAGSDFQILSDLWYYRVSDATWTLVPTDRIKPGGRQHMGFSCGAGLCVAANGSNGVSALKETWVFTEEGETWSKVDCRRYLCPSARQMPAIGYDSARVYHVLFGGLANGRVNLGDTYTFSNTTGRWTRQNPPASPPPRRSAATAFVSGPVNRVVLFGGQIEGAEALCDMWSWTGTTWEEVEQINWYEGPCLHSHSMAWDGDGLVVTGGYVDVGDTPNDGLWRFSFSEDGTAGFWTYDADWYPPLDCGGAGIVHPGARMAHDLPSGKKVFFGGEENVEPFALLRYGDTTVCY